MKLLMVSVIVAVASCLTLIKADSFTIGNSEGATVAYLENVRLSGILLTQRVKNVFYSDANNRVIRAIEARDLGNTRGKASVTSGGVGASFANIRIRSGRGEGLNYQVIIYV